MKLFELKGQEKQVLDIERNSMGLLFDYITKTAKIKIDRVENNANDVNVIPEIQVGLLAEILHQITDGAYVVKEDSFNQIVNFELLFSRAGVLRLDEDNKYRVTLTGLDSEKEAPFNVYNLDHSGLGRAIKISKAEVKSTLSEKETNIVGVDFLYFPNVAPYKVTHLVKERFKGKEITRKVDLGIEQIRLRSFKLATQTGSNVASLYYTWTKPVLPVSGLDTVTIHHDTSLEEDLIYFQVDSI